MENLETKKGEAAILASTFLWGLTPIMILLSYGKLDSLISLALTTLFASGFFALVLTVKKGWRDFLKTDIYWELFLVAFFIGIVYYALYFFGLKTVQPGSASLILLMEAFTSYLFFNVWKKEEFSLNHTIGALLMVCGAVLVLFDKASGFGQGSWLILLATVSAPLGNYYQQRLRKKISSEAILFGRSIITVPFVFLLALLFGQHVSVSAISQSFWFLFINGFLMLGFCKLLWVEGIHRISVTKAVALESFGPLITIIFAFLILHQKPALIQLLAFFPLAGGLLLLTSNKKTDNPV